MHSWEGLLLLHPWQWLLPWHPLCHKCSCYRCNFRQKHQLFWHDLQVWLHCYTTMPRSRLLDHLAPFAFDPDDTVPQSNFDQPFAFDERYVVPESNYGGGAAAGSLSVHEYLRNVGIHLPPLQESVTVEGTAPSQPSQPVQTAPVQTASSRSTPNAISIPAMYPMCSRVFSDDFDSSLHVDWNSCSAGQVYDVCASPHMKCGQAASTAYLLRHAISTLTGELGVFCPTESRALKEMTSKTIKPSSALRSAFENCCSGGVGVLEALKRTLTKYTQSKANIIRWRPGVVIEENPNLLDQLRLASLMVDPRFVCFVIVSTFVFIACTGALSCLAAWRTRRKIR